MCLCSHFVGVLQVRELQQQLKGAQHQLRLAETRVQEMEQLQREARDSTESLATLRGRLQEEQLCRYKSHTRTSHKHTSLLDKGLHHWMRRW